MFVSERLQFPYLEKLGHITYAYEEEKNSKPKNIYASIA